VSSFLVVVDANVLIPAVLCDFMLRAASADMYRLVWTDDILDEVRRTLIIDLSKSEAQANRRIVTMKAAFPEALITQHAQLIPAMTNDPKDRHVLAAAVASAAQVIVTSNISNFSAESLEPFSVEA
jgi:predicted nucleic acid-binding protein